MMKKFINAILVVEGSHDISRICEQFDVLDFVTTNGYSINPNDILYLQSINSYKIVVLTDSDTAGDTIRLNLNNRVKGLVNVKVNINCCDQNNKHGVAECTLSEISDKLAPYISSERINDEISKSDLYTMGLIGDINSREKRRLLANKYILGNCNANNFIRRCTIKNVKLEELKNGN